SAQFPLHVWLPDAMEGPTPVSALMHAATMVTAGVFLMARSTPLIEHSPAVLAVIALVGVLTAVGAAAVAFTRKDLKRILAYSTVSQLGFMMLAIGTGNTFGAVFHLITHGFFKALLFLCAGSVIHGLQDSLHGASSAGVDEAGGLSGKLPITFSCFTVGALALAGFPPLSGFFSKDLILEGVLEAESHALNALVSLLAAASSFYIFRMLFLTFLGERGSQSGPRAHAHEPGLWMRVPLILLAVLSAAAGALGPSGVLARMFGVETPHLSLGVSAWGTAFGVSGLVAAWLWTMRHPDLDWEWRRKHPEAEAAFDAEFGWQPFMSAAARLGGSLAGLLARSWEKERWDRFTEGAADSCVGLGEGLSALSRGRLNEYAWWMAAGAAVFLLAAVL
ncbi:MAG: proton-conducting transporter membrane subunit, partial [Elusimicrobiota bacterium]